MQYHRDFPFPSIFRFPTSSNFPMLMYCMKSNDLSISLHAHPYQLSAAHESTQVHALLHEEEYYQAEKGLVIYRKITNFLPHNPFQELSFDAHSDDRHRMNKNYPVWLWFCTQIWKLIKNNWFTHLLWVILINFNHFNACISIKLIKLDSNIVFSMLVKVINKVVRNFKLFSIEILIP